MVTSTHDKQIAREYPPVDEARWIAELTERLLAKISQENTDGIMRRDAHPKMHGLVKAEFIVEPGLPPELAVGLFAKAATYPAWIRYSNQDASRQSDTKADIRGMAIKVLNVPGTKLLEEDSESGSHDFLTISTPVLVSADVQEFTRLIRAFTGGLLKMGLFCLIHPRATWNLLAAMKHHGNPLTTRYWSTTPYLFGDGRAVKYSNIPHVTAPDGVPAGAGDNYLRQAMVRTLASEGARFDFCVQFQTDADTMPIEDAGDEWHEHASPFRKVATIHIPPQVFDTPERDQYGNNVLSFNPWHALAEHRPLGGINRARKLVYRAISTFRHQKNKLERREPDGYEID